ncbi:Uncharacterised protein [Mycobacterium tuberculosis]|uniref:Uncharacterized protein n=1 Tax=Mycobacterium tuberculosis TaxID=1773 RepID=A0A916LC60_MYCTX|nr:Uncharacterised protein [Mycobacterium tuberculosis]
MISLSRCVSGFWCSTAATSGALNVEQNANRSSARYSIAAVVPVAGTYTPSRASYLRSSSAKRSARSAPAGKVVDAGRAPLACRAHPVTETSIAIATSSSRRPNPLLRMP